MTDKTQFIPVTAREEQINELPKMPGYVYFASDSGKIYFDYDTETRLIMGGSGATIFYAAETDVVDTGFEGIFVLNVNSLEDSTSFPKENDIIVNTDSCFYRVLSIEGDNINTTRIAISGSGSGGGSGEGPGESGGTAGKGSVQYLNGSTQNVLFGEDCFVEYLVSATDSAGDETGGKVTWILDNVTVAKELSVDCGEGRFNVGPFLKNSSSAQSLVGRFSLDVGLVNPITVIKTWKINAIDVSLSWDYDTSTINSNNNFLLRWNVAGGASIKKVSHILIDDSIEIEKDIDRVGTQSLDIDRLSNSLGHGVHTFELYATFDINGKEFETERVKKEVIFADRDNNTPIIAVGEYSSTISQYDTLMLPIYIFNSNTATLIANGAEQETWDDIEMSDNSAVRRYWSYTSSEAGAQKLKIVCGSVEYNMDIIVEPLNLNVKEVGGYAFKIKASEFTSNNALKNWSYVTPENENVSMTFSDNFDWVNGGLKQEEDENGNLRQFICVKAGTKMRINYKLFGTSNRNGKNVKIIFKVNNCGKYDAEIINSYDETSKIGLLMTAQSSLFKSNSNSVTTQYCEENYTEYEIDYTPYRREGSKDLQYIMPWLGGVPAGITIFGDDGFTQIRDSLTDIVIGSDDCDVYLYLFKVYEKHLTDNEHLENFIMDALNAKEIVNRHNRNDILNDNGNGEIDWKKLVEKNPDCWVHLYKIPRICKTKKDEIGKSYLSDGTGETAEYYALYRDGNSSTPVLQAGTAVDKPFSYKVQGTSSEKYVISAANLDTKFKNGFVDANGESIKKFSLDDSVPGENYFNTKVNVASCEGANNALNAAIYNDNQPYVSAAKAKNPKKRDTMLFKPGIVFIQDDNPLYEITNSNTQTNLDLNIFKGSENYKNNPFYKQYAICNFGNSKKNVATLHDTENPSEICIEVTDNQNIGQHMCRVSGRKPGLVENEKGEMVEGMVIYDITNEEISYQNGKGNDTYEAFYNSMSDADYDVRYTSAMANADDPGNDGIENASPQQVMGFFNLVKWFALNDPCEYNADTHPYGWTGKAFTASEKSGDISAVKNAVTGKWEMTFPAYTFKSEISFETGDGRTHKYKPVLGGFTVNTYAKTYDADTHEYRMAKLLNECERHLIMDSFVYHYLFIERHLMVDNVAKNTFWTSEDKNCQYWSLIKDYDNDTADGIDNSGKLSFTYGIEPTDIQEGNGISYFNAPNSVWFNFLHGLEGVRKKMYQELNNTKHTWDAQKYLEKFDAWQNSIPERCWVEDYYRKYVRPYEIFNDTGYLAMLEGGKKTYQRQQFERYQESYLGTKYETNTSSYIDIRANAKDVKNISIPVTMYSDCYIFQSWSQNIVKQRAKRGEVYEITCPEGISDTTDATIYWYMPQTYSTIGDIGTLKPKSVKLGEAKRLQSLDITGGGADLTSYTSSELSIEQATLLKYLKLTDLVNLNKANDNVDAKGIELDLSNLKSLREFDGTNSYFTSVKLPQGAPITSVKLEQPGRLNAKDLNYLQEFSVRSFDSLQTILFDNIDNTEDVNTLDDFLLKANSLQWYNLQNVKWVIDNPDLIDGDSIIFLDALSTKSATDGQAFIDREKALSGTLTITANAYSGTKSLEIYEKYNKIYPLLNIIFEADECKLYEVKVLDGNDKPVWSRKYLGIVRLTKEFFSEGNNNLEDIILDILNSKQSTIQSTFKFDNKWSISGIERTITPEEGNLSSYFPSSPISYSTDIEIKPVFVEEVRNYSISYYNEDGSELFHSEEVPYGTKITEISNKFAPYKDDSGLPEDRTYALEGWSLFKNGSILSTYNNLIAQADYTFYAVFNAVDVRLNPLTEKELQVTTGQHTDRTDLDSFSIQGGIVTVKPSIQLKGKITIPREINGTPIIAVGSSAFQGNTDITHVFFERGSNVVAINGSAFEYCSGLKYFEIPSSLRYLGTSCLGHCGKLAMPEFTNSKVLNHINNTAFQGSCLAGTNEMKLPGSVKFIGPMSFLNVGTINVLQLGDVDDACQLKTLEDPLGQGVYAAFYNTSVKQITIYIDESLGNRAIIQEYLDNEFNPAPQRYDFKNV